MELNYHWNLNSIGPILFNMIKFYIANMGITLKTIE